MTLTVFEILTFHFLHVENITQIKATEQDIRNDVVLWEIVDSIYVMFAQALIVSEIFTLQNIDLKI